METYIIEAPTVDRQTAISLMVYHLQLASAYFEVVPEDWAELENAVRREMADPRQFYPPEERPAYIAAMIWLQNIFAEYQKLEDE